MKNTTKLETRWGSVTMSLEPIGMSSHLPKLPYDQWRVACSYMRWAALTQDSEAIVSFTILNNEWVTICWHQEASGGLHIKFDTSDLDNSAMISAELEEALNQIHCTLHSHNKIGASQSGDDADDELQKHGWHITVGNLNNPEMSEHCRFNVNMMAKRDNQGHKIGEAVQFFPKAKLTSIVETPIEEMPENARKAYLLANLDEYIHPKEWEDRHEKIIYRYPATQRGNLLPGLKGRDSYNGYQKPVMVEAGKTNEDEWDQLEEDSYMGSEEYWGEYFTKDKSK